MADSMDSDEGAGDKAFVLDVRQQPKQARMCGSGDKADRRPIDPPPIIRLRIRKPGAKSAKDGKQSSKREEGGDTDSDADLVPPTITHSFFMFASLIPEDSEEEQYLLSGSRTKHVTGSVVSSLFHLKDQSCFVFPDLSVRTEGRWRFKMSMYEILEDGVRFCASIVTDTFQVYSSKRFPGMSQSTVESREAAAQGLRLRIRRPKKTDEEKSPVRAGTKAAARTRRVGQSPPHQSSFPASVETASRLNTSPKRFSESDVPDKKRLRSDEEHGPTPLHHYPSYYRDSDPSAGHRASWPGYGWAPPQPVEADPRNIAHQPPNLHQYYWPGRPSFSGSSFQPPPRPLSSQPPPSYPTTRAPPPPFPQRPFESAYHHQYSRDGYDYGAPLPPPAPQQHHPVETRRESPIEGLSRNSSTADSQRPSFLPTPSRSPDQQWERRLSSTQSSAPTPELKSRYSSARLAESSVRTEDVEMETAPPLSPTSAGQLSKPSGSLAKLLGEETRSVKEITSADGLFF